MIFGMVGVVGIVCVGVCVCVCESTGVCMFKTRSGGSLWQCVHVGGCVC